MEKYYSLSWKDGKAPLASAFAPKGSKADHELIQILNGKDKLPFEMSLLKLDVGKNGLIESNDLSDLKEIWLDYQPNSLAWPLMSEKMKTVIANNLTGKEGINWITARVGSNVEYRNYYIPRFERKLDVLDTQKTMYVKGTDRIIKPHFSLAKVNMLSLFHQPLAHNLWKITSGIYVNEALKKAIQKEKLTGVDFEKTTAS